MSAIKRHKTTLLFVNTRSQAEMLFQELWRVNEDTLPIALHHGSLDVGQRRRVEKAMGTDSLRAIVATSTLDLGIDWGDVDLVVHVGAPKGASRLAQRIGRANHRMDEPSKAILVPANRFEVLECRAALDANYLGAQDTPPLVDGGLDVLAAACARLAPAARRSTPTTCSRRCGRPRPMPALIARRSTASSTSSPPAAIALKTTSATPRIRLTQGGLWRISNPRVAQQYRLNVGTIVEVPTLNVRYVEAGGKGSPRAAGRFSARSRRRFLETLTPGDTFMFAGKVLRFEGIRENECFVSNAAGNDPPSALSMPAASSRSRPISPSRCAACWPIRSAGRRCRTRSPTGCASRPRNRCCRAARTCWSRPFRAASRHYMVTYPFEGRLAHQTLGMLLTRRLDRAGARPLGFVATDYSLAIWALGDMGRMFRTRKAVAGRRFSTRTCWATISRPGWPRAGCLKRTFRNCALISGLIEKRHPGQEKSGRQVTVSADLIYDVLRSHEPDHILLQATRADAATGLLDVSRLARDALAHSRANRA